VHPSKRTAEEVTVPKAGGTKRFSETPGFCLDSHQERRSLKLYSNREKQEVAKQIGQHLARGDEATKEMRIIVRYKERNHPPSVRDTKEDSSKEEHSRRVPTRKPRERGQLYGSKAERGSFSPSTQKIETTQKSKSKKGESHACQNKSSFSLGVSPPPRSMGNQLRRPPDFLQPA